MRCELGHRVLLLSLGTWVHGYTSSAVFEGWLVLPCAANQRGWSGIGCHLGTNCFRVRARGHAPRHPCGLRWFCAGSALARALHGIQALVHSFAFTVFPPPLPHSLPPPPHHQLHHHTPPSPLRRRKISSVTRRPTDPPCDRSVTIQLTHPPSPLKTLESTSLGVKLDCSSFRCRAVAFVSCRHSMLANLLLRFDQT